MATDFLESKALPMGEVDLEGLEIRAAFEKPHTGDVYTDGNNYFMHLGPSELKQRIFGDRLVAADHIKEIIFDNNRQKPVVVQEGDLFYLYWPKPQEE